jgi:hypothetical protein
LSSNIEISSDNLALASIDHGKICLFRQNHLLSPPQALMAKFSLAQSSNSPAAINHVIASGKKINNLQPIQLNYITIPPNHTLYKAGLKASQLEKVQQFIAFTSVR